MKIASSSMDLSAQHSSMRLHTRHTRLRTWIGEDPSRNTGRRADVAVRAPHPETPPHRPPLPVSTAATDTTATGKAAATDDDEALTPQLTLLRDLIERMTGLRLRSFHRPVPDAAPAQAQAPSPAASTAPDQPSQASPGWGAEFEHRETLHEAESTHFSAQGVVRTADGQEIRFSLQLSMQRTYHEESSTTIRLGNAVQATDPLVINFEGNAAQLMSGRFSFDLNADGQPEQLAQLASGSGFLALDRNDNGRIDNGSELFGPTQGNGYEELAAHDQDGNGWIDENDAIFTQLRLWTPQADGGGPLMSLRDAGIGALSLQAAATPFALKDSDNQSLGAIRASSVYLRENGGVGSMQQIDLVV